MPVMPQPHSDKKRRVFAAFVLGTAFLLGQLGAFIHMAAEEHATCAEHQAMVHADTEAMGGHHLAEGPLAAWQSSEGHGDHDHCTSHLLRDEVNLTLAGDLHSDRMVMEGGDADGGLPQIVPHTPDALLRAPKTSPPSMG
jgi:hypothetical protein